MSNIPLWRGSQAIHEQPGSPVRERSADGLRITRIFKGPFQALVAAEPQIGAAMEGTPGVAVSSVRTEPDEAGPLGPGTMTVEATDEGGHGEIIPVTQPPVYEVEWGSIGKSIEQHPRYRPGGVNALTFLDRLQLESWKAEQSPELRSIYKWDLAGTLAGPLSANAQHLAFKLLNDETSYVVSAPIARRTTTSNFKPPTSACGKRENPPGEVGAPPGYEWLKTADRALRYGGAGQWERTEEWTGADVVDHDIYASG